MSLVARSSRWVKGVNEVPPNRRADYQRHILRHQLARIDFLNTKSAGIDAEVEERMRPFTSALALIQDILGAGQRTAEEIVAELGATCRTGRRRSTIAS